MRSRKRPEEAEKVENGSDCEDRMMKEKREKQRRERRVIVSKE